MPSLRKGALQDYREIDCGIRDYRSCLDAPTVRYSRLPQLLLLRLRTGTSSTCAFTNTAIYIALDSAVIAITAVPERTKTAFSGSFGEKYGVRR